VSNTCTSRSCSSAPNRIASVCGAWGGFCDILFDTRWTRVVVGHGSVH
jgi:hypothetical protein